MSLLTEAKAARMTAMKDRDSATKDRSSVAKSILSTLIGELESNAKRNGEEVTDEKVIQACKKLIQSNLESIKVKPSETLVLENEILSSFLPKQMSEDQLRKIIVDFKDSSSEQAFEIKLVMNHLKANYGGQFNGGMASAIAKELGAK